MGKRKDTTEEPAAPPAPRWSTGGGNRGDEVRFHGVRLSVSWVSSRGDKPGGYAPTVDIGTSRTRETGAPIGDADGARREAAVVARRELLAERARIELALAQLDRIDPEVIVDLDAERELRERARRTVRTTKPPRGGPR